MSGQDLFPGFESHWISSEHGRIFARTRGSGPPLLLLHGFPQTHVCWHRIAPRLAETHTVVVMDLRGYGWSSAPAGDDAHEVYSKRAMGRDAIAVMHHFGFAQFALAGHDRGARVGYRLALDHPGRLTHLALLNILPTFLVWKRIEAGIVPGAHWEFLARPQPEPENAIVKDPVAYFEKLAAGWTRTGTLDAFDPRALAAYRASFNEPSRIHAICEDYRAGAGPDRRADEADFAAGKVIRIPTLVVWGDFYLVRGAGEPPDAALNAWRSSFAPEAAGAQVGSGHFVAEEDSAGTLAALEAFLAS